MTTAEVDAAIAVGADTVRAVRRATGAGAGCGSCVKRLSCQVAASREAGTEGDVTRTPVVPVPAAQPRPDRPDRLDRPIRPVTVPGLVASAMEHLAGCPAAAAVA